MSKLSDMYKTVQQDPFPETAELILGDQKLSFCKRTWDIGGETKGLRYGENPDQPAALYELVDGQLELGGVAFRGPGQGLAASLAEEHMIQAGKHPGKINLTDVDGGLNVLQYLEAKPAAVILKHNNPCGAAWTEDGLAAALERAYYADRIAAFGGTIVVNRPMDKATAEIVDSAYFEVVAAPEFEDGVADILARRKNLRILKVPGIAQLAAIAAQPFLDVKSLVDGGMILQFSFRNHIRTAEDFLPAEAEKDGAHAIARQPDSREADDLIFAWAVESQVASNSVLFAKDGATVSVGAGEQDRVGCVELAIAKAYTKYMDMLAWKDTSETLYDIKRVSDTDPDAEKRLIAYAVAAKEAKGGLDGAVAVSDGFFPFRDGVDLLLEQGITAIAQPGGSIRDFEVIQAVNEAEPQAAMVFTGQRSFKH
jgi:phosphoribosylaminoimidazolecarboxamide formyltransferase/IMP cyclohydrolase